LPILLIGQGSPQPGAGGRIPLDVDIGPRHDGEVEQQVDKADNRGTRIYIYRRQDPFVLDL
jgi:hypothetical protein